MFYYILDGSLEDEVRHYARRRCAAGQYVVYRDQQGKTVAGFRDEDRATLFLNLFDEDIQRDFEAAASQSAA